MDFSKILTDLYDSGNLRRLPEIVHKGKYICADGRTMLNLSSNDYLGIASDSSFMEKFISSLGEEDMILSSTSSRLLTGNYSVYNRLETHLASLFGAESSLTFCSGYHMNTGILPAVSDSRTLILADKLVHASIIDGIRLSTAKCIRYRHQDLQQADNILEKYSADYETVIVVTESIFSMDGDVTDLRRLVSLKKKYDNVMLYVDEAHAFGIRGETGLGIAQEQGCIRDIDFLCGTFGKAAASLGAYLICTSEIRNFLVNKMRTLIYTTALPPMNVFWTDWVICNLEKMGDRRKHLYAVSESVRNCLNGKGYFNPSGSHIIPVMIGDSKVAADMAAAIQNAGFYLLPVRPPTVPEGTSRLRISMTSAITEQEAAEFCSLL